MKTCYTCIYLHYHPPEYIKARLSNSVYRARCRVKGYQHLELSANQPDDYPQLGSKCPNYKPRTA